MNYRSEMTDYVHTVLQNPKAAAIVSGGTITTGGATWFDWLPTDIGFYASAVGIVLSLVFIYNNIRGGIIKRKLDKADYEVKMMEKARLKLELEEKGREWVNRE